MFLNLALLLTFWVYYSGPSIYCEARLLQYRFEVSYITASPDGVWSSNVLGINGRFPGPTIEGRVNDTVQVELVNRIQNGQNVSLHWHGIHQRGTPFEDGAAHLTQCSLMHGSVQTYKFELEESGTYWYHSHVNSQYTEGLWGAIVVHPRHYSNLVDNDLLVTLNDWYHSTAHDNQNWLLSSQAQGVPPYPSSLLMNGMGRYPCPVAKRNGRLCSPNRQLRPVFNVERGSTLKIRVINTSGYAAFNFTIEGHSLKLVEVDGVDVVPQELEAVSLGAGQRYAFLLKCHSKATKRFLIRARFRKEYLFTLGNLNINGDPEAIFPEVTGVIQYVEKNFDGDICSHETFEYRQKLPNMNNPWNNLHILDETSIQTFDQAPAPYYYDMSITLNINFTNDENGIRRGTFNGTPFRLLHEVPLLMQMVKGTVPDNNTHIYSVRYGDVVQVVVNNPMLGAHPIHLHGHHFWVMGQGKEGEGPWNGDFTRLTNVAHRRDTAMVLEDSWLVIRFRADNVGVWSLHCHMDWHYITGMSAVFVEEPEQVHKLKIPEHAKRICKEHGIFV